MSSGDGTEMKRGEGELFVNGMSFLRAYLLTCHIDHPRFSTDGNSGILRRMYHQGLLDCAGILTIPRVPADDLHISSASSSTWQPT